MKKDVLRYAQKFIKDFEITAPADPFKIAERLGIDIVYEKITDAEAYLICGGNNTIILSDKLKNSNRVNFTIFHEIGHYIIPWHNLNEFRCSKNDIGISTNNNLFESEANIFASEILLPTQLIKDRIYKKNIDWELIKNIANDTGASLTATVLKVVDLYDGAMAFAYCIDKRVKWAYKNSYFNFDIVSKLNMYSFAYDFFENHEEVNCDEKVYDYAWITNGDNDEIREISISMKNLNAVFTILLKK